jgi:hypothetical protein
MPGTVPGKSLLFMSHAILSSSSNKPTAPRSLRSSVSAFHSRIVVIKKHRS